MARRQFKIPFAATGDTESIPNETQPDGSVSMQQGFGYDYERDPQSDPLAKVFPRDVHNGLLNEITASIGEIQQNGHPIWVAEGAPYPINAVVRHNDANWQSTVDNNNAEPSVGAAGWKVAGSQDEKFNAPIVTIPSAATVDLTALAPNTSQITISGTATINAFTVAAGRSFIAKFSGACALANSAALVTGRGGNLQLAVGDSVIIRATTTNVVEILPIDLLSDTAVGSRGQAWQDVTSVRALNTTYTNSTGRSIMVVARISNGATAVGLSMSSQGVVVDASEVGVPTTGGVHYVSVSAVVPAGATYRVDLLRGSGTTFFMELR